MQILDQDTEIRYRKFYISAGQQLSDLPAFHRLKKNGWQVSWSYQKDSIEGNYIEALLLRAQQKQAG